MKNNDNRFPEELVQIRIMAANSYLIKKYREQLLGTKGSELMSNSDLLINKNGGPRLRQHLTFKDLTEEKRKIRKKQKKNNSK